MGFYRVSFSFPGFYWVLPGFTGFYRVFLRFTRFYRVFTGFYMVLPHFTALERLQRLEGTGSIRIDIIEPVFFFVLLFGFVCLFGFRWKRPETEEVETALGTWKQKLREEKKNERSETMRTT